MMVVTVEAAISARRVARPFLGAGIPRRQNGRTGGLSSRVPAQMPWRRGGSIPECRGVCIRARGGSRGRRCRGAGVAHQRYVVAAFKPGHDGVESGMFVKFVESEQGCGYAEMLHQHSAGAGVLGIHGAHRFPIPPRRGESCRRGCRPEWEQCTASA